MNVLGVETSCDETSVACVDASGVLSNPISSQIDLHARFGGVVPELASRAHLTNLPVVTDAALRQAGWKLLDVDAVAATAGPGLIGAVLMGLTWAKTLAYSLARPFVGVHHIEGHILANGIEAPMATPSLVLVVSGGHTELVVMRRPGSYRRLGATLDDAAGETFDKAAKLMGLGYPGGPLIEALAREGETERWNLPRALRRRGNLDFSFSGLKTAVRLAVESLGDDPPRRELAHVARGLQEAVVDSLVEKTEAALRLHGSELGIRGIYLAGGVAANGPLRAAFAAVAGRWNLQFRPPPMAYCTDNAAMIAWAGRMRLAEGSPDPLELRAFDRGPLISWAD